MEKTSLLYCSKPVRNFVFYLSQALPTLSWSDSTVLCFWLLRFMIVFWCVQLFNCNLIHNGLFVSDVFDREFELLPPQTLYSNFIGCLAACQPNTNLKQFVCLRFFHITQVLRIGPQTCLSLTCGYKCQGKFFLLFTYFQCQDRQISLLPLSISYLPTYAQSFVPPSLFGI